MLLKHLDVDSLCILASEDPNLFETGVRSNLHNISRV